jgi:glutathione peroxidase
MKLKSFWVGLVAFVCAAMPAGAVTEKSAHDFVLTSIEFKEMPMAEYKGKAVLLVNTASYCGYTPQYEGLQALWDEYRDKGLVVLGVPANDFGDQEPGAESNIKRFCEVNFQVDFPMTKKMVVKGGDGNAPIYDWLASEMGEDSRPKWNFHKYLIDAEGHPVAYFPSKVTPQSAELKAAIDKVLQ